MGFEETETWLPAVPQAERSRRANFLTAGETALAKVNSLKAGEMAFAEANSLAAGETNAGLTEWPNLSAAVPTAEPTAEKSRRANFLTAGETALAEVT